MAPKPPKKPKKGKPPPIDKLLIPAVGIGLALLAYQFMSGLSADLARVNVHDELELRDVLFGEGASGNSYVVLCQDEESTLPISSVFNDAFHDAAAGRVAQFRLLDCNHSLQQSGKTIAEKFSLDLKIRPTIFLSGASIGDTGPIQVPAKHLKTGDMLVKLVRNKLEARAAQIKTTQDLRTKCLDKDICALLLKGTKKAPKFLKDAMAKLLEEFPNIAFAAINSQVLYVKNLEEYLNELQNEEPRFVVFKKVSGSLATGGERLKTSIAPLNDRTVSYGSMSNQVAAVVRQTATMKPIPALPTVKTRTKKLEQEEKAKRQRRMEQERRAQEKKTTSSGGSGATANDGSKEGRRLERERRRAEHRAQHNVREKTPEEIAEMERKRRARMEQEAAKWNVAPEDAPPEGDYVLDDEEQYIFEDEDVDDDDGTTTTVVEEEEDDGEDEEVIDLD